MKNDIREQLIKKMKNKRFLYEVHFHAHGSQTFGVVLADDDHEAKAFAKALWPKAVYIQRDDWGKGPKISI